MLSLWLQWHPTPVCPTPQTYESPWPSSDRPGPWQPGSVSPFSLSSCSSSPTPSLLPLVPRALLLLLCLGFLLHSLQILIHLITIFTPSFLFILVFLFLIAFPWFRSSSSICHSSGYPPLPPLPYIEITTSGNKHARTRAHVENLGNAILVIKAMENPGDMVNINRSNGT